MMARITAERLIQHLTASGFVVMKGPARPGAKHGPHAARQEAERMSRRPALDD
jgi:hypothetical protein